MKRVFLVWAILIVALSAAVFVFAQGGFDDQGNPNDPNVNERANACYEGGELAGKCDTSDLDFDGVVEEWEVERMWECGWHYIRWQNDFIRTEDFPDQCEWLLPPPTIFVFDVPTPEPEPEVTKEPPVVENPR